MRAAAARRRRAVVLVAATLLAAPGRAQGEDVLVFAAASLTDALEEIGRLYAETGPDRLRLAFGASSDMARQIAAGAPADVFFSADPARMDELERAGLVAHGDRRDVLSNTLAIVVRASSTLRITDPGALRDVSRLALADPEAVPAGIYARRWLEDLGLWSAVRVHVVPTLDVRAALAAVAGAHADAGIVYRTDAAIEPRVRVALEVPRERGPPIVYTLAPLAAAKARGARAAAAYLAGPAARAVYARRGFLVLAQ